MGGGARILSHAISAKVARSLYRKKNSKKINKNSEKIGVVFKVPLKINFIFTVSKTDNKSIFYGHG